MNACNEVILLKYGEVVLKGLNRNYFNQLIEKNVRKALAHVSGEFTLEYAQSILFVRGEDGSDMDGAVEALKKVFGIVSICRGLECEKNMDVLYALAKETPPNRRRRRPASPKTSSTPR